MSDNFFNEEIKFQNEDGHYPSLKDVLIKWAKRKKKFEWIIFVCFIIVFGFNLFSFIFTAMGNNNLWFDYAHYFTIQTNILILFVLMLYVINPNMYILSNNKLIFAAGCYIFITCLGFNVFLLPQVTKNSTYINISSWFDMLGLHLANPIAYWVFVILQILYGKKANIKMWKWIGYSAIYPVIYLIYLILLPVNGVSVVYDGSTNLFNHVMLGHFPADPSWSEINFNANDELKSIKENLQKELNSAFEQGNSDINQIWTKYVGELNNYYKQHGFEDSDFKFRLVISFSGENNIKPEIKVARSLIQGGWYGIIFPISAVILYFVISIFTYYLNEKFLLKFKKY